MHFRMHSISIESNYCTWKETLFQKKKSVEWLSNWAIVLISLKVLLVKYNHLLNKIEDMWICVSLGNERNYNFYFPIIYVNRRSILKILLEKMHSRMHSISIESNYCTWKETLFQKKKSVEWLSNWAIVLISLKVLLVKYNHLLNKIEDIWICVRWGNERNYNFYFLPTKLGEGNVLSLELTPLPLH